MTNATNLTAIHAAALILITEAQRCGVVVTIENKPHHPLAMGHHDMRVSVRPSRRPPPSAANYTARLGCELYGLVLTALAQANRLIEDKGSPSDLAQDRRDLPETLRVLRHAVQQGLVSLADPNAIDYATELHALRKKVATYEARDALGWIPAPAHPDDAAVDRFAAAMKAKLASARAKGCGGWEDKEQCHQDSLALDLRRHVNKGDPVDVGNFAMMLHQRGESTKLRPLSQDLVDAIKNAPPGASVIEHNGHPVFITRATEEGAPLLGLLESNHSELQAQVSSIKHLAGEIVLQMGSGSEVPQDLESGMVVDVLYTPASEEAPDARVR